MAQKMTSAAWTATIDINKIARDSIAAVCLTPGFIQAFINTHICEESREYWLELIGGKTKWRKYFGYA